MHKCINAEWRAMQSLNMGRNTNASVYVLEQDICFSWNYIDQLN